MKKKYLNFRKRALLLSGVLMLGLTDTFGQTITSTTFVYTGAVQNYTVPSLCSNQVTIEVWGAEGGGSDLSGNTSSGFGGKGGYAYGTRTVVPNSVIYIYVGGFGQSSSTGVAAGGFNGGGSGYASSAGEPGNGGGGATDVRIGGLALANRVIIAGGGGGGGEDSGDPFGHGGGLTGVGYAAWDATQIAPGPNGALGLGASTIFGDGGGGGGGYYGGGSPTGANVGDDCQGGGGGSGFIGGVQSGILIAGNASMPNPVGGTTIGRAGNGFVRITYVSGNAVAVVANPSVICAGGTSTLTASGVTSYTWNTGSNSTTLPVSPLTNTTYTLSGTDAAGCTSSLAITVPVNTAIPSLTISNTAAPAGICFGKTATLTASGAVSYTWVGGAGGVQNGQSFIPTATAVYTVTGQNGCGVSAATTTILVAPLPVAVASSSNNICAGSSVVLTATAAVNGFTWMPGSLSGTNVTVAPLVNTVYTLTASDGTCSGVATLSLTTKSIPTLAIVATGTNVCEGSSVTMTVSGASTYTWVSPSSNASIITVNPSSATSYVVSGTNANNCISGTSQIIVTKPNPVVVVSTNKSLVCEGGASTLTATGGSSSYTWVNGPGTNTNVVNPTVSSTYTVTGTAANGCTTDKTITINVLSVSVTVSSPSTTICEGNNTTLNAGGATTYSWVGFGNFASATVSPTLTTTYTVNASTTSQGLSCPSSNTITVTVNALPTVSVSSTKTLVCRTDGSITITASGAASYVWSPTQTNNTLSVRPQATTTYSVTGTDANGCQDGATIQIVVSPCTGIEELGSVKTISVYPNPSNGEITVTCESDITLKVMNDMGQLIQTITLNTQNDHKVSVKDLANGVYFIVGQNETETVNQKIVVNK